MAQTALQSSTRAREIESDADSRLSLVEPSRVVRWDDSDVRPDFNDARLTLGYCLGVETEVKLVPPDESSSEDGATSTMSEDCDRRLVNGDAVRRVGDSDVRTAESSDWKPMRLSDNVECKTNTSSCGGVFVDIDSMVGSVDTMRDKTDASTYVDSGGDEVLGSNEIGLSQVRQDSSDNRLEEEIGDSFTADLDILDRFDVIAGIVNNCDVVKESSQGCDNARPDIMEDCDFRLNSSSNFESIPDIADICDIVLELEDTSDVRPDIVDVNDVKLYQLESVASDRANILINQCEIIPDIVENSNMTANNSSANCFLSSGISEHCETQSKVSRVSDVRSDNAVGAIDGSRNCFGPPDVIDTGDVRSGDGLDNFGANGDISPDSETRGHTADNVEPDPIINEANIEDESRPGSVGHLLKLVRALASNLGSDLDASSGTTGNTNLGFEDTENLGGGRRSGDQVSQASSNEDIDWSWLADETQLCASGSSRPSSWLRASMRRVRRFALGEPQARVATTPSHPLPSNHTSTIAVRSSAPPRSINENDNNMPSRSLSVSHVPNASSYNETVSNTRVLNNARPTRSQSVNHRSSSSHIPDIVNSVNTSRSIVPPNRCVSARIARHSSETPSVVSEVPSAWGADDGPQSPTPSAPPESPRNARDPDDFPRRYSHLGRLEGRRPEDTPEQPSEPTTEDESNSDYDEPDETKDWWPHSLSSLLASLGCTLGLFNVSRFAILSVHFGANFVIQFLFLSLVVGWPLYTLHASLGQHLKAGVVDMWRISPLFQGIGIALLMAQAMLGLYSVVGVAWMFTYFRDSFINKYDAYRWAENGTKVEDSVPEYLNTVVLQRQGSSTVGHLKFQVTFNLAVVWMIVFVCLSKGVKSYGKSVYLFATVPIFGISILAIKVLTLTDIWFDHTAWNELFMNSNCWTAAAIECMMTWGLLGAATMQMRSHSACCRLSRECLAVGAITIATLVLAALLANGFAQLLWSSNLRYVPSSFEHSAVFLSPAGAPRLSSTPVRWMPHGHHVVGLQVSLPGTPIDTISGYQAAQFATELAPAVFAKLGPQAVSPFWTVLFYFTLILLGISQQLCIWHCVITGIMAINITRLRSWETTITFLSCSCGFVLGLPMTTELGIAVVYFMDYCVGGAWWLILLQAAQIIAALMAQGGEQVAHTLLGSRRSCLQAFVVFTWNVVLPLALTVVSVSWFRSNHYRDLYSSRHHGYWPAWARRLGCLLQLVPLIIVPLVAAVQTWRYLTKGPSDLFDRLRLLCRPGPSDSLANQTTTPTVSSPSQPLPEMTAADDPPPKYTPPPSYSTATGARIAKMLRRSFRRLVAPSAPSPPDYSAVLVEMGGAETAGRTSTLSAVEVAHILRSSMRRTLRREQVRSAPSPTHDSSKSEPVI